jgi:hypothetical protein
MGQESWNIVLRNHGAASCSLRGWPGLTVRGPGGSAVPTRVSHVRASNLRAVPDAAVNLRPGSSAVVTMVAPVQAAGCVTRWSVGVTLPGASTAVNVAGSREPTGLCVGGQMQVSPFYAESGLESAIAAMRALPSHPAYATTKAAEPAACRPAALRASVASDAAQAGGTVLTINLATTGPACVVTSGGWPTVRLHESGGASQVAKGQQYAPAASPKAFTNYEHGGYVQTALTLRPGTDASIALLAPAGTGAACRTAGSATIYPTALALGTGTTVPFSRPLSVCGEVRTLSYQAGQASAGTMSVARGAMAAAASPSVITPDGDSPNGFWYGSDGPTNAACGSSVPYNEASGPSDCGTTEGRFGGYLGETGRWDYWKGCDSNGIGWNTGAYNDAQANFNDSQGVGAGAYWMMGGPGRSGNYTSASADTSWGQAQGARALSDINSDALGFPYVFMDIEQFGGGVDNGWDNAFSSTCGGSPVATTISTDLDRDTFNGFYNEIENDSSFMPGVYSAGGGGTYEWTGIFGTGNPLGNSAEWTYEGETGSLSSWPSSFAVGGTSASWFASAPSNCHLVWQWTGGAVTNGSPDFRVDQFDGNNVKACN